MGCHLRQSPWPHSLFMTNPTHTSNNIEQMIMGHGSWVMGHGFPFSLEDRAPWTPWKFIFEGFTDSPHPHKQNARGLDTIHTTSFFPWWLLLFFQENYEAKGDLQKFLNQEKIK